jgi:hypothetical protein
MQLAALLLVLSAAVPLASALQGNSTASSVAGYFTEASSQQGTVEVGKSICTLACQGGQQVRTAAQNVACPGCCCCSLPATPATLRMQDSPIVFDVPLLRNESLLLVTATRARCLGYSLCTCWCSCSLPALSCSVLRKASRPFPLCSSCQQQELPVSVLSVQSQPGQRRHPQQQ